MIDERLTVVISEMVKMDGEVGRERKNVVVVNLGKVNLFSFTFLNLFFDNIKPHC